MCNCWVYCGHNRSASKYLVGAIQQARLTQAKLTFPHFAWLLSPCLVGELFAFLPNLTARTQVGCRPAWNLEKGTSFGGRSFFGLAFANQQRKQRVKNEVFNFEENALLKLFFEGLAWLRWQYMQDLKRHFKVFPQKLSKRVRAALLRLPNLQPFLLKT